MTAKAAAEGTEWNVIVTNRASAKAQDQRFSHRLGMPQSCDLLIGEVGKPSTKQTETCEKLTCQSDHGKDRPRIFGY